MSNFNPKFMAQALRTAGKGGDTELVHVNPAELATMKTLLGPGRQNPTTGLPSFELGGDSGNYGGGDEGGRDSAGGGYNAGGKDPAGGGAMNWGGGGAPGTGEGTGWGGAQLGSYGNWGDGIGNAVGGFGNALGWAGGMIGQGLGWAGGMMPGGGMLGRTASWAGNAMTPNSPATGSPQDNYGGAWGPGSNVAPASQTYGNGGGNNTGITPLAQSQFLQSMNPPTTPGANPMPQQTAVGSAPALPNGIYDNRRQPAAGGGLFGLGG